MKVYVLTQGSYSDYHIIGVTLDKEKAEETVEKLNYNPGVYDDPVILEAYESDAWDLGNLGCREYCFIFEPDGTCGWATCEQRASMVRPAEVYTDCDDCVNVHVYTDKGWDHARKIAWDTRAKHLAEKEGLV